MKMFLITGPSCSNLWKALSKLGVSCTDVLFMCLSSAAVSCLLSVRMRHQSLAGLQEGAPLLPPAAPFSGDILCEVDPHTHRAT